jgi:hypothetical protein
MLDVLSFIANLNISLGCIIVEIEENTHHPANGRKSYKVKLTAQGRKTV